MEILILIFFDWINLDARKASSPAGLLHPNGNWRVRNNQGYDEIINENIVDGIGFVAPCSISYADHLYRNEDGSIAYSSTIGQYMYYELKLYLERYRILYQLEELKDKIYKIKQKIEINRDLGLDTRELTEMLSILYEAHFYYYSSFCEELDSAIQ